MKIIVSKIIRNDYFLSFLFFILIFLNGYFNILSLSPHFWFERFDQTSESLVLGGLTMTEKCRNEGRPEISPHLGLIFENKDESGLDLVNRQYKIVSAHSFDPDAEYKPYQSQFGLQKGIIYPWFAFIRSMQNRVGARQVTGVAGMGGNLGSKFERNFVLILKFPVVLFSAITFTLLLMWFIKEFGIPTGIGALCLVLLGGWITVFSSNIYWMIASFYLPTVIIAWCGYYLSRPTSRFWKTSLLIFTLGAFYAAIFFKCLMGYEYISTIAISATVPALYYSCLRNKSIPQIVLYFSIMATIALAGFLTALHFHYKSLVSLLGQDEAVKAFQSIVLKNTHNVGSNANLVTGLQMDHLNTNPILVVAFYLFSPMNKEAVFLSPALVFLPGLFCSYRILTNNYSAKMRSLALASIYSMAAPLSWYILAKGHSASHFHFNFILWYLPTLFFMLAVNLKFFSKTTGIKIALVGKTDT